LCINGLATPININITFLNMVQEYLLLAMNYIPLPERNLEAERRSPFLASSPVIDNHEGWRFGGLEEKP
jgi:hypothetical protein